MYAGKTDIVHIPARTENGYAAILKTGYVYWVTDSAWDKAKKKTTDKRVSIGKTAPEPGKMYPNATYARIFGGKETECTKESEASEDTKDTGCDSSAMSVEKTARSHGQDKNDWSGQTMPDASIDCLDKDAIALARQKYKERMNRPHISEEVDTMTDEEFLTQIRLMRDGKLTNAAMVLLGNEEYDYKFSRAPEISWRLFDSKNFVKDYCIFKVPFITAGERALEKVRRLTYRYMPDRRTLFATQTQQYDDWLLRELMNNCIAHMDYTIGGRIYLNEFEDKLILTNPGTFLPGSTDSVLQPDYNDPPLYRNKLLAETMVKLNMTDMQAMGIRNVFRIQQKKFFPLPDYDFSVPRQVGVTVFGKELDSNYTRVLFDNPGFDLATVCLIDRVQKHAPIPKEAVKELRRLGVIKGRVPNIYITAEATHCM